MASSMVQCWALPCMLGSPSPTLLIFRSTPRLLQRDNIERVLHALAQDFQCEEFDIYEVGVEGFAGRSVDLRETAYVDLDD